MKYITLKNMERATKLIENRGYEHKEANDMAITCFAMCSSWGYQNPVEYYINMIIPKVQYEKEYPHEI